MPDKKWPGSVELGRRISKARRDAAVSRQELANLANTDVSNLGRIENGIGNPSFLTLVRIAASLGIDPSELVKGIGGKMIPESEQVLTIREWAAAKRAAQRNQN